MVDPLFAGAVKVTVAEVALAAVAVPTVGASGCLVGVCVPPLAAGVEEPIAFWATIVNV